MASKRIKPTKEAAFQGGTAIVQQIFRSPKFGTIAGVQVVHGSIRDDRPVTIHRVHTRVHDSLPIESLRQYTKDVEAIEFMEEGGIGLGVNSDVEIGDLITQDADATRIAVSVSAGVTEGFTQAMEDYEATGGHNE